MRIEYSYRYSGPAITVEEYVSIGYITLGVYDEIVKKSKTYDWPEVYDYTILAEFLERK